MLGYMLPKLISFKLCPFVKKAEILFRFKGVEFEVEHIELAEPPSWFMQMSPLKKVPLLVIDNQIIFESSVICEYLDEVYPKKLHPDDALLRAQNRSWIEFGNSCLWDSFYLTTKETKQAFDSVRDDLLIKLDHVELAISGAPYFNGKRCSLLDLSFAPLFKFLTCIDELNPVIFSIERHPKLIRWKNSLLELSTVKDSYCAELEKLHLSQIWKRQGYLSRFLDDVESSRNIERRIY
jgi:glutathione S-transferase